MKFKRKATQFLKQDHLHNPCRFADPADIETLRFRSSPYWHVLYVSRHIGIHRPDDTICNWSARFLTKEKQYKQKCLGPALDLGKGSIGYRTALARAFEWFESGEVKEIGSEPRHTGRTTSVNFCPIGDVYTVGRALRDYSDWTRYSRSVGGHYNNLVLINYHLIPNFGNLPLEEFSAKHLQQLAEDVLTKPKRYGFSRYVGRVSIESLSPDELRRRKRTFNSLVSILKMAFQHAWNNAEIQSERPWRCLKRIPVNHQPRTIFLDRGECKRLLDACGPALRNLVLAGLYTGCRIGELGSLRVSDVGRYGYGLYIAPFKRSPARFVFLPDEGMAFFLKQSEGKPSQDPVLVSDKGKPWRRQHSQLFRRAVAKAGLPLELVFHGLRHTYASDLIRQGVPIEVVAKQLGHSNTITVSNTYGHLAEQFREAQIRERFSPLSNHYRQEVVRRKQELSELWTTLQSEDWRDYARLGPNKSTPRKSFATPVREVAEVFDYAEGRAVRV